MSSDGKRSHAAPIADSPESSESAGSGDSGAEESPMKRLRKDAADDDVPGSDDDSSSDDDDGQDDNDSDVDVVGGQQLTPADREIQVEFEARSPQECDYYGLIHLLKQMLRPSCINISQLADRIIAQKAVGSVITQSPDDNDDTDDESDGENAGNMANGGAQRQPSETPTNEVFGVGTVLKLIHGPTDPVGDQIVSHLLVNTAKSPQAAELRAFFNDETNAPGFLISERILNMPPQISVPMYETLQKEIRKAVAKNLPFQFTHYLLITRLFVSPNDDRQVIYTNAEEEVFLPECDMVLDMDCGLPAARSSNNASSGRTFSAITSDEYIEKRKLLVFRANKLEKITSSVKGAFPIN